jgi:hypothetical protein
MSDTPSMASATSGPLTIAKAMVSVELDLSKYKQQIQALNGHIGNSMNQAVGGGGGSVAKGAAIGTILGKSVADGILEGGKNGFTKLNRFWDTSIGQRWADKIEKAYEPIRKGRTGWGHSQNQSNAWKKVVSKADDLVNDFLKYSKSRVIASDFQITNNEVNYLVNEI